VRQPRPQGRELVEARRDENLRLVSPHVDSFGLGCERSLRYARGAKLRSPGGAGQRSYYGV
jgi:hypothetical protein